MLKSGADGELISGSGPTVYGLARKESQAKNIYNAVNGCCNEVYLVRLLGSRVEKMRYKRSERIVFMTQYLMNHPNKLIPLTFFVKKFDGQSIE